MTAKPEIHFRITGCPPSLANLRGHWQKARVVKEWREITGYAAAAARVLAPSPALRQVPDAKVNPVRRRLAITLHRCRLLDEDNAVASLKGVIDGCVGQLLVDDSPRWMRLFVYQHKVEKRGQEAVEVSCANWDGVDQGGFE